MNINEINTSVSISVPIPLDENVEKYSYSEIVIQLIKYILHVRRQIPFNYDTFSYLMNKNKHKYDGNVNTTNVLAARRYKIYEATLKSLNNLFQNLQKEITTNFECIHQISIVLGGSPVTAKEVYDVYRKSCSYLNISNSKNNKRYLFNKILSSLMKSPQLQQLLSKTLPVTNTYILIKTSVDKFESVEEFLPKDNFKIPVNCTKVNFDFNEVEISGNELHSSNVCSCECRWYQSKEIIKGFKDELVNGKLIWL